MKSKYFRVLLMMFIVLAHSFQISIECEEDERLGLLGIKSFFLSYDNTFKNSNNPFDSWVGANCCNWDRVKCDNDDDLTSTAYVIELFLHDLLSYDPNNNNPTSLLNASLFQDLKQLKTLDLSYNTFSHFTANQGFNHFSSFDKLETLNLTGNYFENQIIPSLIGLPSMNKLVLEGNLLKGSITLLGLEHLTELHLGVNQLSEILQLQGLENLTVLDVSYNNRLNILPEMRGLQKLRVLNLSGNHLDATIQGLEEFSSLNKLEILNLQDNNFNNSIFSSLKGFVSLKILNLDDNDLGGIIPTEDIAKLTSLEILDLSHHSYYDGAIPLQDLKKLRVLDLSYNQFNGTLPIQGFCESNSLFELNIKNNQIRDKIPECIGNFTNLKFLDVSRNQLSGEIPSTAIAKLTSIEYLSFLDNDFEGSFSFSSLANHSKLWYFMLSGSDYVGNIIQVETEDEPQWQPTFQLEILTLKNCNLNKQAAAASNVPSFLLSQNKLIYIDLAHNHLTGAFPFWLLQNNSELVHLDLSDNLLTGPLQLSTSINNLRVMEISNNLFSGQLPTNLGFLLPKVEHFNLSRNNFEGNLPLSIEQMKSLHWLDLSNNNFSGDLQISMFNYIPFLEFLLLGSNNFSGSIEDGFINTEGFSLVALDISNNMISGKIPSWIGSLKGLQYVQISKNHFAGELPVEMCSLSQLIILDVSQNQLFGKVPSCFNSSSLVFIYMQRNYLSGSIPLVLLSSASSLKILDLSYNHFSGHIPEWFKNFTSLRVLLLKENELEGPIPQQLCQVEAISMMDLSNNRLNGSIPSCFNNIMFGIIKGNQTTLTFKPPGVTTYSIGDDPNVQDCGPYDRSCPSTMLLPIIEVKVDFTTKHRSESYKGNVLNYMSGLDLSNNQLTGDIPYQIGDLVQIHALNFSNNNLVGHIPKVLSNLKQLESLDLSNNLLSGNIPPELTTLDYLSIFNVSYNNLSGMIPTAPHFTYPPSSFYGNPYLCGSYIEHKCSTPILPTDNPYEKLELEVNHGGFIDLEAFFWSFAASYIILLLGFVAVLCINPQWRQRWSYFIEDCCYFLCKAYLKCKN
ncbi:receptor-like protein 15 [Cucumis sativus]|uniref:receptor-like protein 15 n=1 Tax=Cucumis sativus TaxID=3659 RepID=UPI0012F4A870|nr:receptor-like protein 15 [Cucumis sativus]